MASSRLSTSSTSTSRRLRTKTSELSGMIRNRRDSNPPSSPSIPSPSQSSEPSIPKPKRRIPFLNLRRKPDTESASSAVVASQGQAGAGSHSPRLSHIPTPNSPNAHSSPPLPPKKPLAIPKSISSSALPASRSTSPVTLRPSRSITPTAPHPGVQSPSSHSFPSSSDSPLTSPTRLSTAPQGGPTITVSSPSPDDSGAPGLIDGNAANRSPSPPAPNQDGYVTDPSHAGSRSPSSRLRFPRAAAGALSDSETGSIRQATIRERKSSFFDRFKGVRPGPTRTPNSQSSTSANDTHSSSTLPLPSAHTSKTPPETSQDLEAVLSPNGGMLTEVMLPTPSSPTANRPMPSASRTTSPASSVRRLSMLPASVKKPEAATSSRAVPLRTRERGSLSGGSGSESASSSRIGLSSSGRNQPPPLARSATSVSKSATAKRVSPPTGGSWLLTKLPVPPTADNDPSPSSLKAPTPATRTRAASDSRALNPLALTSPTGSAVTPSSGAGGRQRRSVNGDTTPSLRSAWQPNTTPPSGPLPEPPFEAPSSPTASVASLSVSAPPRISILSTGSSSSGPGSAKTLSTMSSIPSSLSSGGVSSTSSARTIATTVSSASAASRLSPSVPSGTGPKSGNERVVARVSSQDSRSSSKASTSVPSKKVSPPSSLPSPSLAPDSPTASAQTLVPLAPTPSNIYALQTENAALKAKIESLERAARRHEREIRGLRWLVVNGSNASLGNLAGVGQPKNSPAQSSFTPSPPPMSPTSTDTEPLSDGTTDVGSPEARDTKFLMGSESDSGVSYGALSRAKSNGGCSVHPGASDPSGNDYFTRKQPLALQRARQVREEAGKVLGRGLGVEFSVDVDPAREAQTELASIQESPRSVTPDGAPAVEVPSTEPEKPPEPESARVPQADQTGKRQLKDERRASRALKRLSVTSTASQITTLGTGDREGADVHAAYAQNLARGRAFSIEQVIELEREREERREREGLKGMEEVLEKLKTFAGVGKS